MLCPICAGEFQPRLTSCPSCECGLVPTSLRDDALKTAKAERGRYIEFAELCRPVAYPVAMVLKQMLEQNGVSAIVQGGHSLSILPHLVFGGELRVMVDRSQLEYARALYRAYFEANEETDFLPEE